MWLKMWILGGTWTLYVVCKARKWGLAVGWDGMLGWERVMFSLNIGPFEVVLERDELLASYAD